MATDISTVDKLRDYLNDMELKWPKGGDPYFGQFGDQPVASFVDGGGYAPAVVTVDMDYTIIICTELHFKKKTN